jgi:hypothetical protein
MINDETQDQDLQKEQKAMPADAKALLDKVHMTVPGPPPGDEWIAEAVKAATCCETNSGCEWDGRDCGEHIKFHSLAFPQRFCLNRSPQCPGGHHGQRSTSLRH